MRRSVIYVAHPLSGTYAEMERNRLFGAHWCAWLCRHFRVATVADWVVMSTVLEETPANRAMGIECDLALIERCDAIVLVGTRISAGMQIEADHARKLGKPVVDLTVLGIRCPTVETRVGAVAALFEQFGIKEAA